MKILHRAVTVGAISAIALVGVSAPALGKAITVNVKTTAGLSFTGMPSTLKAGTYTFRYTNSSGTDHNLKVGATSTPTFKKGTKSITITLKKGKVDFVCTVYGHSPGGMKGTITVK